jgi:prepilin-type processing-associated H-X9-DG protein
MLVVCSIVLFLLALLVPGLGHAKEQARRVQCTNNLRQWGVALQLYRDDNHDYIPMEGNTFKDPITHVSNLFKPGTWFNELPPYLDMPAYRDIEGVNASIREFKNGHIWICPSKELTDAYKSSSGMNQFHYGMNQVLNGMGDPPKGSRDTPGFPNPVKAAPLPAKLFARKPHTVFLFDIAPNSPSGSPRDVATEYARTFSGGRYGKFHGDYANFLFLDGGVGGFTTSDIVAGHDLRHDPIIWNHPQLYWGYPPPSP